MRDIPLKSAQGLIFLQSLDLTPSSISKMLSDYETIGDITETSSPVWKHILSSQAASGRLIASDFLATTLADCAEQIDLAEKYNVEVITIFDSSYPIRLKYYDTPPLALFTLGDVSLCDSAVAYTGTLQPDDWAKKAVKGMARAISSEGFNAIARSNGELDEIALNEAIVANTRPIMVLDSSFDHMSVRAAQRLETVMDNNGCALTEHMFKTPPSRHRARARERIVTGAALATVYAQGDVNDDCFNAVRYCVRHNRKIYSPVIPEMQRKTPANETVWAMNNLNADLFKSFALDYGQPFEVERDRWKSHGPISSSVQGKKDYGRVTGELNKRLEQYFTYISGLAERATGASMTARV